MKLLKYICFIVKQFVEIPDGSMKRIISLLPLVIFAGFGLIGLILQVTK